MDRDGRIAGSRNFGLRTSPQKQSAVACETAVYQYHIALSPFDVYLPVKHYVGLNTRGYAHERFRKTTSQLRCKPRPGVGVTHMLLW